MSKVTVKKQDMVRFLNLVALKGDIESTEALVNGTANGLDVVAVSPNTVVACKGTLGGNFAILGQIGLDNISVLKKFINTFTKETVDIELDRNKLTISAPNSSTKASAVLREPTLIKNVTPVSKLDGHIAKSKGNEFTLTKATIKDIVKHYDTLGSKELKLKGENAELMLLIENNENEIVTSFSLKETVEPFSVGLPQMFIDLVSVIDNDVQCSIRDGAAIYILLEEENIKFEFIVAPLKK